MIDKQLLQYEVEETRRLNKDIELIASENYPSQDILDLMGSHFSVKYSEGFPLSVSKQGRHYAGCEVIDKLEEYAIAKACELFKCNYANVQPWSGSQANQAVYAGLLKPGDTVLGMDLNAGGHLTHVSKASATGSIYNAVYYGLDDNGELNYKEIDAQLYEHHPRLLVVGASAYPRIIDFERIRKIVDIHDGSRMKEYLIDHPNTIGQELIDKFKTYILVDMAHVSGLVAAEVHPSPLPYADVVTTTTHKTLRGPRGGMILWNDPALCKKLNSGVFPRIQGGSNQATIAAKAQCFIEALDPSFKQYANQILLNMKALIAGIKNADPDFKIGFVSNGSENHLALLDLKNTGINGKTAEERLAFYGIITNKNMIAGDTKPSECTGLRIGTAAITTRGFDEAMSFKLGTLIAKIILQKTEDKDLETECDVQELIEKMGDFYKSVE